MERPALVSGEAVRERLPDPQELSEVAVFVPAVTIALSEGALFAGRLDVALWGHLLTLLGCITAPLLFDDDVVFPAFALVSLFRLVNLGLPVFVERTLYSLPVVYGLLLFAVAVVVRRIDGPAIRESPRIAALGTLPAIALGGVLAEVGYAVIAGSKPFQSPP